MTLAVRSNTKAVGAASAASPNQFLIFLLVLSLVMPFFFFMGGLRLSMYRLYLILMAFPILVRWLNGSGGSVRLPDILVIMASLWMTGSLMKNHGLVQWQFAGILMLETLIPYLTARVLIRDLASFRVFVQYYFAIILLMLPFALIENQTGDPVLMELFRGVLNVYRNVAQEPRLGLERAQVTMQHPILFGVFCAPAFALCWYVITPQGSLFKKARRPFVVSVAVFSSLSSGAFLGILFQSFLIGWDELLKKVKNRWKIFAFIFGSLYLVLELASNRNAFQIIASELTFSAGSAWNRINIFRNAIDDIFRNPVLGLGLKDWTRPGWLRSSVDNFWLLITLRYGIPTWFLLTLSTLVVCWKAATAPLTNEVALARRGYIIAFIGMSISAFTVHLWDATYCIFMFLLGAGVWFSDSACTQNNAEESDPDQTKRRVVRYTRFADYPAGTQS